MDDGIKILMKNNAIIDIKPLQEQKKYILPDEDIDLNGYRILLLIYALRNVDTECDFFGKHKLVLYDFLAKFPENISKVAKLKNKEKLLNQYNVRIADKISWEIERIREYIYNTRRYNIYFNYLISKELIEICFKKRITSGEKEFCIILTEKGMNIGKEIYSMETEWVKIIELINEIFGKRCTEKGIIKFLDEKLVGEYEKYDY